MDATFLGATLDGVRLAERRSYEARFSVMGETQVGAPLFEDDFRVLTLEKGKRPG